MSTSRRSDSTGAIPAPKTRVQPTSESKEHELGAGIEELEERIAPKLASNHNETFLADH